MSAPHTHFRNCPSCGDGLEAVVGKSLTCPACQFTYFFNPTIGVAGFVTNRDGDLLLIERGREPALGKLAPPGGFADVGETAEQALSREVFEETGIKVNKWKYLTSAINQYAYKNVTYPVIDFFYTAQLDENQDIVPCSSETNDARWQNPQSIAPEDLAFASMQQAFKLFKG
jgi:ADP-ribose pyrophosphatase YjhB (NUDIX family)